MSAIDSSALAAMLGKVPSGLFVLVARGPQGQQTGLLVSWVQQASFAPPAVTVCIRQGRYLHSWLQDHPDVVLHSVGENQKRLLSHFGKGFEPDEPAFTGLETTTAGNGLTVLSDTIGWLEGRVIGSMDGGDHAVYLIEITGAAHGTAFAVEKPWVHLRKNGLSY